MERASTTSNQEGPIRLSRNFVGEPYVRERLKISRGLVYDLVSKGEIPHIRLGRVIRFDPDVIDQWISEQHAVGVS